jgi:hypothetical protein
VGLGGVVEVVGAAVEHGEGGVAGLPGVHAQGGVRGQFGVGRAGSRDRAPLAANLIEPELAGFLGLGVGDVRGDRLGLLGQLVPPGLFGGVQATVAGAAVDGVELGVDVAQVVAHYVDVHGHGGVAPRVRGGDRGARGDDVLTGGGQMWGDDARVVLGVQLEGAQLALGVA